MSTDKHTSTWTGLEVFLEAGMPQIQGKRVGLVTNPTGVDSRLRSTIDLLLADQQVKLRALFGPEHGIHGNEQAGVAVEGATDAHSGLPMYSLYGKTSKPTAEMLQGLDALIFDMQDIGVRYATYISTMAHVQEAAAEAGLVFVVFDRPNPLSGKHLEGNMLDARFTSFVGIHPLPIQHGMTIGELARMFAAERGLPEPVVVTMQGWRRDCWYDETELPWVQPSPNLPTLDAVTLYAGTCLFEGCNCSEGRGTTRPFEIIGAPWIDPFLLKKELAAQHMPGIAFRPAYFLPTFSKHTHQICGGVQVHIQDRTRLRSVETGLRMLHTIRRLYSENFGWIKNKEGKYFIDLLAGCDTVRLQLDAGTPVEEIMADWNTQLNEFEERRQPFLLYSA